LFRFCGRFVGVLWAFSYRIPDFFLPNCLVNINPFGVDIKEYFQRMAKLFCGKCWLDSCLDLALI